MRIMKFAGRETILLYRERGNQQDFDLIRFSPLSPGWLVFWGLAVAFSCAGAANSPHYSVQRWEAGAAEEGLPQNTVTAIALTRDGCLWVLDEPRSGGGRSCNCPQQSSPTSGND
jgi:hypothetical protein